MGAADFGQGDAAEAETPPDEASSDPAAGGMRLATEGVGRMASTAALDAILLAAAEHSAAVDEAGAEAGVAARFRGAEDEGRSQPLLSLEAAEEGFNACRGCCWAAGPGEAGAAG